MTIELDEDFAFSIYDFSLFKGAAWQEAPEEYVRSTFDWVPSGSWVLMRLFLLALRSTTPAC